VVKISMRRRAIAMAGAGLALGLAGCAVEEGAVPRPPSAQGNRLLTPWLSIDGGWRLGAQRLPKTAPIAGGRITFIQPVGVAAFGNTVLVADAGARTLWRLDRSRDAMAVFAPFTGAAAEQGASLQLGNDFSAWVALPAEHEVVQYDLRGRLVRRWRDEANATRPVTVAVPDDRSEVLVGDAATARVVIFNPLGRIRELLGNGSASPLQSIAAMSFGPRGLYVLDPIAQQVVLLGARGEVLEVIGENQLVRPRALAVDRSGRVFVSDDTDQTIKVFRGAQLLATAGGIGGGPGRFGRIEALAVDGNMLYVADSVNARVQVMLVAPPSMERQGAVP
jgi:DNA-binding beta-propeller fold protein YncE